MQTIADAVTAAACCDHCDGTGIERRDLPPGSKCHDHQTRFTCSVCRGTGLADNDICGRLADDGVQFLPGSPAKVKAMAIRYTAGLPLWHDADLLRRVD